MPGPSIVRLQQTMRPPVVSRIVPVTANEIVSAPGTRFASETAWRDEPEPESFVFVTSNVAAAAGGTTTTTAAAAATAMMTTRGRRLLSVSI